MQSQTSGWQGAYDLADRTKISVIPNTGISVLIPPNEPINVTLSVFEPCLWIGCAKNYSVPRIIWTSQGFIAQSDTQIQLLLTESNITTQGLCY